MNATSIIASLLTTANTTVTLNNGLIMPTMLWGSGGRTQENVTSTIPAVRVGLICSL